jgi:NAD(P)H-flavin reductase/hemoglobin-like flavoprotein
MIDVERMRRSFSLVSDQGDEVPLFFYSHLFLSYPETRSMFPVSMMQQRDRLFTALGHIVAKVDDLDELVPFLQQLGRDHRKFGTLAEHYPAVGASLLATLEHFAGDEWTPELAADWAAAYGLVAQVMSEAAQDSSEEPAWWDAKVVSHERRSFDIAVIRVQPRSRMDYLPGQSLSLETQLRPRLWRFFSPATAPREDGVLEFHVRAMDGGPVGSALVRSLAVGDIVRLGPPVGRMILDTESDRDLLMIAGGTGLAPMKALIDQVAQQDMPRRVSLFVGGRTERDLYDLDDLEDRRGKYPWLTVSTVVSHDDQYPGEKGYLADVVVRNGPWASCDVYVCGSPEMVNATVPRLVQARVPAQRIRTEEFAPSWPGPKLEKDAMP